MRFLKCLLFQIHVDRYKYSVYTSLSDPFLRAIVTRDEPQSTRFHACERAHTECVHMQLCKEVCHLGRCIKNDHVDTDHVRRYVAYDVVQCYTECVEKLAIAGRKWLGGHRARGDAGIIRHQITI